MKTIHLTKAIIVSLCMVLIAGCGRSLTSTYTAPDDSKAPNLNEWVANEKAKPAPPLDPLPVMKQFETFEYAAQGLRDPFSAVFSDESSGGLRPSSKRAKQKLEEFPLDTLKMVGTMGRDGRGLVGLILATDKVVYRVSPGSYIGQNEGRITAIHPDRIDIVELTPDGAGGWLEQPASIAIEDK